MKSKIIIFLFFCLNPVLAQNNCEVFISNFNKLIETENYKEANQVLESFKKECASVTENYFPLAISLLQYNVDMASEVDKENAINELVKTYNLYDKNFPQNKNSNVIKIAMLLYDNQINNENEIFSNLNKAFQKDKFQFTDANALYTFFKLYKNQYETFNQFSFDNVVSTYAEVLEVIEKNKSISENKSIEFDNAKFATKSLVKNLFTSEKLINYSNKNFESNKENINFLQNTATLLFETNSSKNQVFEKIVNQLNKLNPSSKSNYYLADFYLKNRQFDNASIHFENAAQLATDSSEKATIYYTAAKTLANVNVEQAQKMVELAIASDSTRGDFHIFLANLYLGYANQCTFSEIEKKALNQLIKKTLQKAVMAEKKYQNTSDKLINSLPKSELTQEESKKIKKENNSVQLNCWINQKVVF